MFNDKDILAGNNEDDYMRHFGFTVEDLSFLISPQSSLSPIKKKQRNVFNFEGYQDDGDVSQPTSARDPPAPGTYPGNYPTVYEPPERALKQEPVQEDLPMPSFDGLDLACFDESNQESGGLPPPPTYSTHATAGSGASTIMTEQQTSSNNEDPRVGFGRMGSSAMNMGSLAFSTMSSFNFDEAEADELNNMKGSGALGNILSMNVPSNPMAGMHSNGAIGIGMYPYPEVPPLPSLVQMTGGVHPAMISIEDASFILHAQQQQINHQQRLLDEQRRVLTGSQWFPSPAEAHGASPASGEGSSSSQPVSRIGSFKSQLPPLSVDLNALNAAHNAHHAAKLQHASGSGSQNNSSAYSLAFPNSNASSNRSSSEASSPEHQSFLSDHNGGTAATGGPKRRGSESSVGGGTGSVTSSAAGGGKDKDDASRASKSLATISRRFVEHFGDADTFDYISGQLHVNDVRDGPAVTNRVDGAAEVLGVHVRRIYELIKILEILSLVTFTGDKRGKFSWRGTKDFLMTLGAIQADGIAKYPEVAYANGVRLSTAPLASPSISSAGAFATSPLTSAGNTPVHDPQGAFEGHHCDSQDSQAGAALMGRASDVHTEGIAGCESTSADAFDKHSLAGGHYINNVNRADYNDMNIENIDFVHSPPKDIERSDLDGSELDAFVQLMGSDMAMDSAHDVHSDGGPAAGLPKYSKKRAAVKKSSKTAAGASGANITSASGENHEEFMVEGICKSFLQLFLVGMDGLSMNFAIQRLVPMEPNQTLSEYNKQNATKIRRVYDVANVLCSLSLINKVVNAKTKGKSEVSTPESTHHKHSDSSGGGTPARDLYKAALEPASAGGRGGKDTGKSDAKVLEWGSFAPSVIREYYLSKMH